MMGKIAEAYWTFVGQYTAGAVGWASDAVPFAITEILEWAVVVLVILGIAKAGGWLWRNRRENPSILYRAPWRALRATPAYLRAHKPLLFLLCLVALYAAENTARIWVRFNRPPLVDVLDAPQSVSREQVDALVRAAFRNLVSEFDEAVYLAVADVQIIASTNQAYPRIFGEMGITGTRTVRVIKPMRGLSRVVGFSYGGPGYYSPVLGEEAVLPALDEWPEDRLRRATSVAHEMAHGAYFQEVDAEIASYLALTRSEEPILRAMGYAKLIEKSLWYYECDYDELVSLGYPEIIFKDESEQWRKSRERHLKDYFVIWLSEWGRETGIQNDQAQYGGGPVFNERDEFFRAVWAAEAKGFGGRSLLKP